MSKLEKIENNLLYELISTITEAKKHVAVQINSTLSITYWQVGKKINEHLLENKRADYGKRVVTTMATQLAKQFGKSFESRNLRRMMQFASIYTDFQIVVSLTRQLSWTHILVLIPLKSDEARSFYANQISKNCWGVRETRRQIEKKAYERTVIAKVQSPMENLETHIFKDPYFLDFLGLKNGYLEKDLEAAIINELEQFILELGAGFTFVERQKRMIIDGEDFSLDLLFYHRKLQRLVAVELKIGKFKAAYKGQMELYLKWLNRYEKEEGENAPIGLILCPESSREQIELLEMHKDGIVVAEYLTDLPPKDKLEEKLHSLFIEAKERIARIKIMELIK